MSTKRTTLTLPSECLEQAATLAAERRVNLSVVMSEALTEGLRAQLQARRGAEILEGYKTAFGGFSEEELLVLDGILLEPVASEMISSGLKSNKAAAGKRH